MLTLTARQCPHCVLRFGSSSELEQHLRLDHTPGPREPRPEAGVPAPAEASDDEARTEPIVDATRFVVRAIVAGTVIALVSVISWQAAALLSVLLVAIVAARASEKAAEKEEVTPCTPTR